jgi:aryl-alcohol dehydrogenase-like predicted oxidoreductase
MERAACQHPHIVAIAEERGCTPSQVALAWVNHRRTVASTIIGVRTLAQLEDDLGAADMVLSPEETGRLDIVSAVSPPDYPYGFISDVGDARREAL